MKNMNKDEILEMAKKRGVKLNYLSELIGGYRGKLTDWKSGKTTLSESEIKIITDYLSGLTDAETQLIPFLTEKEKEIIRKYRRNPKIQYAVDKLLGIDEKDD